MLVIESIVKNFDLRKCILFILVMLVIYRIGVYVLILGVDGNVVFFFF